jgi:hypothetical protein
MLYPMIISISKYYLKRESGGEGRDISDLDANHYGT